VYFNEHEVLDRNDGVECFQCQRLNFWEQQWNQLIEFLLFRANPHECVIVLQGPSHIIREISPGRHSTSVQSVWLLEENEEEERGEMTGKLIVFHSLSETMQCRE
jgi:hypothetical protein